MNYDRNNYFINYIFSITYIITPSNMAYRIIVMCLSGLELLNQLNIATYLQITSQPRVIRVFKYASYISLVFLHLHNMLIFKPKESLKDISNEYGSIYGLSKKSSTFKGGFIEKEFSSPSFLDINETYLPNKNNFLYYPERSKVKYTYHGSTLVKRSYNVMIMLSLREIILNIIPTICLIYIMGIVVFYIIIRHRKHTICSLQYYNLFALIKAQEWDCLYIYKNVFIFLSFSVCYIIGNWTRYYARFNYFGDIKLIRSRISLNKFFVVTFLMRSIEETYINVLWILITFFEMRRNNTNKEYPSYFDL
ncbi:unnamed protein product [Gordionus sp. m RMFG-2023]